MRRHRTLFFRAWVAVGAATSAVLFCAAVAAWCRSEIISDAWLWSIARHYGDEPIGEYRQIGSRRGIISIFYQRDRCLPPSPLSHDEPRLRYSAVPVGLTKAPPTFLNLGFEFWHSHEPCA